MSVEEWAAVEKITSILNHFAKETTRSQSEKYTLSDFFGGWARIKMELTKYGDDLLAKMLLSNMKHREEVLFNNKVLNAAVFLDPRYQKFMSNQNKEKAIAFLSKLYKEKECLRARSLANDVDQTTNSNSNDELESFLSEMCDINEGNMSNANGNESHRVHTDFNRCVDLNYFVNTQNKKLY